MSNAATPSTDAPEGSTALPVHDHLCAALALLRYAYECALDAHAAPWDFALEIDRIYEAGLTITDLRWLVVKGLVEHGDETSLYGDEHRTFTRSAGLNFLSATCVVLTKTGAAFACQVLQATAAAKAEEEPLDEGERAALPGGILTANGETRITATLKPKWDPARWESSLAGRIVKRFQVPARNQELILSVFEEQGWQECIDDPLPGDRCMEPKTRLNDVIYRLNHRQLQCLIRFHANGNGNGVRWSLGVRKTML